MRWKQWIGLGLLALCSTQVMALSANSVYEVAVRETQTESGFKIGLQQVLVRLTGQELDESTMGDALKAALKSPKQLVSQYSHVDGQLQIKFSEPALNRILSQDKIAVFPKERPLLMIWVAVDDNVRRYLVGGDNNFQMQQQLNQSAKRLALPVVLPTLDLEDLTNVSVTDVYGQFPSVLLEASERYGANAVLVGRLKKHQSLSEEELYDSRWQLLQGEESYLFVENEQPLTNALEGGVKAAFTQLLQHAQISETAVTHAELRVAIKDISNQASYNAVYQYLKGLSGVRGVEIDEVNSKGAVFKLELDNIDKNRLVQVMDLSQNLLVLATPQWDNESVDMMYRWVP